MSRRHQFYARNGDFFIFGRRRSIPAQSMIMSIDRGEAHHFGIVRVDKSGSRIDRLFLECRRSGGQAGRIGLFVGRTFGRLFILVQHFKGVPVECGRLCEGDSNCVVGVVPFLSRDTVGPEDEEVVSRDRWIGGGIVPVISLLAVDQVFDSLWQERDQRVQVRVERAFLPSKRVLHRHRKRLNLESAISSSGPTRPIYVFFSIKPSSSAVSFSWSSFSFAVFSSSSCPCWNGVSPR